MTINPSHKADLPKTFRMGELFSGPGGLATGAFSAKIDDPDYKLVHKWANDYDLDTTLTYSKNICHKEKSESVVHGDIRELSVETFKKLGKIDAFAYGFPCNDFSTVGERKGMDGEFGPLYSYGLPILEEFQPYFFVAENVSGLSSNKEGNAFKTILKDLSATGYKLVPHLYKFEDYGIPQARHRIIIVGIREDLPFNFEVPSPEPYKDIDISVKTALSNIPTWATGQERTKQSATVVERLQHILPGQNAFTADLPEHLRINTKTKISQIYRRLDPEKPSYTVTGSGGGGTHMYHWEEPRALTNRERARLQTFPDDFVFVGSKESVRKQIGMAVPVAGSKIIFEAILKTFAGIPYASIEPSFPRIG
ncbi:DNA cytosine methyltransferase [Arcanobacterium phocae]|uniref:DNA cytosine methyltransferase n=1 Tax=Arcanobacterium phocae TaxID=131112 RepID=UPI001C0E9579|nr:DNA cytosine methyltransferase [Arcanobacterium phocae]